MADQTQDVQRWLNAAKDGDCRPLAAGRYVVTDTIVAYRAMGLRLAGSGGANFGGVGWDKYRCGTILEWQGPPDKPVVTLSGCSGLVWDGLNIDCKRPASACVQVQHGTGSLNFTFRDCGFVGGNVGIQWGRQETEQTCANALYGNVNFSGQTEAAVRLANLQSLEHQFNLCQWRAVPIAVDVRCGGDVSILGGGTYEVGTFLKLGNVSPNTRGFDVTSLRFDGDGTRTAWLDFYDTDRAKSYGAISFTNCTQNNGQKESDKPLLTIAPGARVIVSKCGLGGSLHDWCRMYSDNRAASELYVEYTEGFETQPPEMMATCVQTKGARCHYEFRRCGNMFVPTADYVPGGIH